LDTRARRRARELATRGIAIALDQVREELARRDERDRGRADSPLQVPPGARVVNTSALSIEEQIEAVLEAVREHPAWPRTAAGEGQGMPLGDGPDSGASHG